MNLTKPQNEHLTAVLLSIAVGVLFYFNFSVWHFSGLNSDHAIHILMAENFSFSKDLYYWGQDRLGSILPLIGAAFVRLGADPVNAMAITQILVLCTLFTLFCTFVSNTFLRLVFLTLITMPIYPFWMLNSLGHPYLGQLLFCFLLLFIVRLGRRHQTENTYLNKLQAFFIPLAISASLWSSELSIVFVLAVFMVEWKTLLRLMRYWYAWLPSAGLGYLFLRYAKHTAVADARYETLVTDFDSFLASLLNVTTHFQDVLLFQNNMPFNALLSWATAAICIGVISFMAVKKVRPSKLTMVFLLASLGSFFAVHLSYWNTAMNFPLRFYVPFYIFFMVALLSAITDLLETYNVKLLPAVAIIYAGTHLFAAYQFQIQIGVGTPWRISRDQAEELIAETLADERITQFSVIGSYWNSHLLNALSVNVKAVPYYGEQARRLSLEDEVKANAYFVLILTDWLDEAPEHITERGIELTKIGPITKKGRIEYALYKKNL